MIQVCGKTFCFMALTIINKHNHASFLPKSIKPAFFFLSFADVMTTWQVQLLHNVFWAKVQGAVDRSDMVFCRPAAHTGPLCFSAQRFHLKVRAALFLTLSQWSLFLCAVNRTYLNTFYRWVIFIKYTQYLKIFQRQHKCASKGLGSFPAT